MTAMVRNGLPELLFKRKIRSAAAFARLMTKAGYKLSTPQSNRYMKDEPPAFTLHFMEVACAVLDCRPGDLFIYEEVGAAKTTVESKVPATTRAPPKPEQQPSGFNPTGPKVRPLPKVPRK